MVRFSYVLDIFIKPRSRDHPTRQRAGTADQRIGGEGRHHRASRSGNCARPSGGRIRNGKEDWPPKQLRGQGHQEAPSPGREFKVAQRLISRLYLNSLANLNDVAVWVG